ncbi:DUF1833 family protein [Alcaligenaceae bacterium]|nr:DUF1833 family protein [Alcaligenaceae bacterium]
MTGLRDPQLVSFFLDRPDGVSEELETLEISDPDFSKTYYIVRNAHFGLTARDENGVERHFEYYPMTLRALGQRDTLDYGIGVALGDQGEIVDEEVHNMRMADALRSRPKVVYRAYRADDLSKPMIGPINLQIDEVSTSEEGASFDAVAPSLNLVKTGEFYTVDRFPQLLGWL